MRRASDISQEKSFIAAPEAGKHKDPKSLSEKSSWVV
jgi:hypothetical protein